MYEYRNIFRVISQSNRSETQTDPTHPIISTEKEFFTSYSLRIRLAEIFSHSANIPKCENETERRNDINIAGHSNRTTPRLQASAPGASVVTYGVKAQWEKREVKRTAVRQSSYVTVEYIYKGKGSNILNTQI